MNITSYFRPFLRDDFSTYAPSVGWDDKTLKLDAGENAWTPKVAIDWESIAGSLAYYPDSTQSALRQELAMEVGLSKDWICLGNGSDELIDLCCRLFLSPGDSLLDCSPTFPMYSFFGRLSGANIRNVPRLDTFQLDMDAVQKVIKEVRLVFLANPNNPTGTQIPRSDLLKILRLGVPVVVDEAYAEFSGESVVDLVTQFENLMVLRTFSKWAGIAGARIGWMVANPMIIGRLLGMKAPYNVNSVAIALAMQAQTRKREYLPIMEVLKRSRDEFVRAIRDTPELDAIESRASCVCITSKSLRMRDLDQYLRQRGIIVKVLPEAVMKNTIRISVAPKKEMIRVLQTIQEYVQETNSRLMIL